MGSSCSSHSYGVFWEDCWHYCGITSVQIARPRGCNYRFLDEHQRFGGAHCSNIGKDRGVLNDQTFAIMVLMALFTTFITTPIVISVYKPAKLAVTAYKHRTIKRKNTSKQL
ncbi:hypothetical protein P3S68_001091 [Capsicum galapagoense]